MKKILFAILIILTTISCHNVDSVIPRKIWKNLNPYKPKYDMVAIDELHNIFKIEENRVRAIKYVNEHLINQSEIKHIDQLRLGTIVQILRLYANTDEHGEICKLIANGGKYLDYYAMVISYKPPYIFESIRIFERKEKLTAYFVDPDGTGKKGYSIKEMFLKELKKATSQDFGYDYGNWKNWWLEKGQFMKFDSKKDKYY